MDSLSVICFVTGYWISKKAGYPAQPLVVSHWFNVALLINLLQAKVGVRPGQLAPERPLRQDDPAALEGRLHPGRNAGTGLPDGAKRDTSFLFPSNYKLIGISPNLTFLKSSVFI